MNTFSYFLKTIFFAHETLKRWWKYSNIISKSVLEIIVLLGTEPYDVIFKFNQGEK